MNDEISNRSFYAEEFCMDGLPGRYAGYTDGDTWNGWACPYFTKDVAEAVLRDSQVNGIVWTYNEAENSFIVTNRDDLDDYEPAEFRQLTIGIGETPALVFPIGAYLWIWEVCK